MNERLTKRNQYGHVIPAGLSSLIGREILEKLAALEDLADQAGGFDALRELARAKAEGRVAPEMRPMTIDEAIAYGKPMFLETVPIEGHALFEWNTPLMVREGAKDVDEPFRFLFRYWPDEPTLEQSAACPWGEEAGAALEGDR